MDEASDHRVKDEGQDLADRREKKQALATDSRQATVSVVVFVSRVCATCSGRLSMREQQPKAMSSRLVRMKALMTLVNFWIVRSRLFPLLCLRGHRQTSLKATNNTVVVHLATQTEPPPKKINHQSLKEVLF